MKKEEKESLQCCGCCCAASCVSGEREIETNHKSCDLWLNFLFRVLCRPTLNHIKNNNHIDGKTPRLFSTFFSLYLIYFLAMTTRSTPVKLNDATASQTRTAMTAMKGLCQLNRLIYNHNHHSQLNGLNHNHNQGPQPQVPQP